MHYMTTTPPADAPPPPAPEAAAPIPARPRPIPVVPTDAAEFDPPQFDYARAERIRVRQWAVEHAKGVGSPASWVSYEAKIDAILRAAAKLEAYVLGGDQ